MRMFLCSNSFIRRRVYKRNSKKCWFCKKLKRLLLSYVFYTAKNWSHWSERLSRWLIDWQDYRWVCRDCINKALEEWQVEQSSLASIERSLIERRSLYD